MMKLRYLGLANSRMWLSQTLVREPDPAGEVPFPTPNTHLFRGDVKCVTPQVPVILGWTMANQNPGPGIK